LTTKEQILEEAFKIPWTFPFYPTSNKHSLGKSPWKIGKCFFVEKICYKICNPWLSGCLDSFLFFFSFGIQTLLT